jgi:hypothetical protein
MIDWTLRILVAAMFAWSAYGKLRRPGPPLITDPRIPAAAADAAAPVVAVIEAIVAALVLIPATHVIGGVCTAALGGIFTIVLARRWVRGGVRLSCGCFGSSVEQPAWIVTGRAVVVTVAGVLIATGAGAGISRATGIEIVLVLLTVAVVVLAVLVLALYRHVGVLERRLGPRTALEIPDEGPPFGLRAPRLDGLTGTGSELIAFGSDHCRLCRELTPGFRALARDGLAIRGVDEDADPEAFARFRVPGTPYVVHTVDGVVVAKGLVNTLEQVEELVGLGLERAQHAR